MKSLVASLVLMLGLATAAHAASDVYVHAGGEFKPVSIAVTPLAGDSGAGKIGGVIANDMAHSIFLTPINPATFPEKSADPDAAPNLDAWKTINAQFVLTGAVEANGGKLTASRWRASNTAPRAAARAASRI
jgi:TolB protein